MFKSGKELGWDLCSCSSILWKVELGGDEIRSLAGEILKPSVEGAVWFLLSAYSKMQEERNDLKKEFLREKKPELKDVENLSLSMLQKKEAACSEENMKPVAKTTI